MSMHKIPLTLLEEEGLRLHGLPIGTPSQRSDTFRQGVAWGIGEAKRLTEENERQHFDILAMNQSLDLLRAENERLRKDAERYRWLRDSEYDLGELFQHIQTHGLTNNGIDAAIDAARGAK